MKSENFQNSMNNLLRTAILPLLVALLVLGAFTNANAQKYELKGAKSKSNNHTELTLTNSTVGKYYYLFRVDGAKNHNFVTFMVGQGYPLQYAPQKTAGTYVVYEFNEFKEMPFNLKKYKPTDGIKQNGEVTISAKK